MKANSSKIAIYQVLPRLLGNAISNNITSGTLEQNGSGKFAAFNAEVLATIAQKGFTHVWYTGVLEHATQTDYTRYGIAKDYPAVVKGQAGSPYAIKDYYDVCPDLALDVDKRMQEFEALVRRTHQAGLGMLIDFVPNHVARVYGSDVKPQGVVDLGVEDNTQVAFDPQNNFYYLPGQAFAPQFALQKGAEPPYSEYPAKATGNDCFTASPGVTDWYETVKLNYGVDYRHGRTPHFGMLPDTWLKMRDILMFWAAKGVDGFRCDMAEMVPVEFWAWVIPQVKQKYPMLLFVAEVYNPAEYRNYIFNGQFDYLYDKVGLYDTLRRIMQGQGSASEITACWQQNEGIQDRMLAFLENHDEQRIASRFFCADNKRMGIPAMVVATTLSTAPIMLYAGQELAEPGMDAEGFSGTDGRTTIFDYWCVDTLHRWYNAGTPNGSRLTQAERQLEEMYRQVVQLAQHPCVANGSMYDIMYANHHSPDMDTRAVYAYMRKYDNTVLLVVANFSEHSQQIKLQVPAHAFEWWHMPAIAQLSCVELLTGQALTWQWFPDTKLALGLEPMSAQAWQIAW